MRLIRPIGFALLLLPGLTARAAAQLPDPGRLVPGAVLERVVSTGAPSQSYALFLPTRYDTGSKWPVLILMDPRGRAMVPLGLLHDAAERYGYIVLSSYNTRSDEPGDPNAAAVNAMLADAQRLLAIDPHRLYLVGFSGTARAGWEYAYRLEGNVAGLLGFGAGFPSGWVPPAPPIAGAEAPLVFYGGAGLLDFNYEEVVDLDNYLDSRGVRHHVAYYPGPHSWPPRPVMDDALTWIELQAMRRGLSDRKEVWIDSLFAACVGAAAMAETAGQPVAAYRLYRAAASDFRGLRDVAEADRRAARLEADKPVQQALGRQREVLTRYQDYFGALRRVVADLRRPGTALELPRLLRQLSVERLQREAADPGDSARALSARRLLEQVFTFASFYWPRIAVSDGNPAKALVVLDLAEAIHPGRPGVCERRRETLRLLGRADSTGVVACTGPSGS